MGEYDRMRRQQVLREAEGYLELVLAGQAMGPAAPALRDQIGLHVLSLLRRTHFFGRTVAPALLLEGEALKLMERHEEAIGPLERSAELAPECLHVWLALGWCHKRMGRLDLAIQALEKAMARRDVDAIVPYNLACYWSLNGNHATALAYLSQALEMQPSYRDMVSEEPDFDAIRNDPEFQALTSVIV